MVCEVVNAMGMLIIVVLVRMLIEELVVMEDISMLIGWCPSRRGTIFELAEDVISLGSA